MQIGETIEPRGPEDFAAWLGEHGPEKSAIWVLIYKKASGRQTVTYEQLVEVALCYGWIDGVMKGIDGETYAQRFSPRRKNSSWTETNRSIARRLIDEGRMTEAGRAALPEDMQ